jgi:hypothetical protein
VSKVYLFIKKKIFLRLKKKSFGLKYDKQDQQGKAAFNEHHFWYKTVSIKISGYKHVSIMKLLSSKQFFSLGQPTREEIIFFLHTYVLHCKSITVYDLQWHAERC